MMKKFLIISFIFLLLPSLSLAEGSWQKNLRLGDRGPEVFRLQVFLNQNSETQVALAGPGSPGQETNYFGSLTQRAVIRLQNKYAAEILAPVGLTNPTGFFGPSTRNFLNQEIKKDDLIEKTPKPAPPPIIEAEEAKEKTENSSSDFFDDSELKEISQDLNWPEQSTGNIVLNRISPSAGSPETKVTIFGQGFSKEGNIIYTGHSVLNNISSPDGRQLSFTIPEINLNQPLSESFDLPLWIYVQNDQGISNNLIFNLNLR